MNTIATFAKSCSSFAIITTLAIAGNVAQAQNRSPGCFDPAHIGLVGKEEWGEECAGKLIVDDHLLQRSGSASHQGTGSFAIKGPNEETYTFGDSEFNIFTGQVYDMSGLFMSSDFNDDISYWNTSNVKRTTFMFYKAEKFDQDISSWNVRRVKNADDMFNFTSRFDQDLSGWCFSNIERPAAFFANGNVIGPDERFLPKWGDICKEN